MALVDHTGKVIDLLAANQDFLHRKFGGIVPEIASRNHTLTVLPLIEDLLARVKIHLSEIDGIAVTARPGLIGSLMVGVITAKTLALSLNIPFIAINHLEGHLLSPFLHDDKTPATSLTFPYLGMLVSGGHTSLYRVDGVGLYQRLGATLDDAAGEAFDKFAKLLGLEYPGGIKVDQLAKQGNRDEYSFPHSYLGPGSLDFSFSGLKTAALRTVQSIAPDQLEQKRPDLCASYQETICQVLIRKLGWACEQTGLRQAVITGGVSANSRLREVAEVWAKNAGIQLVIPPLRFCTDNGAMIALAGLERLNRGESSSQSLAPAPRSLAEDQL